MYKCTSNSGCKLGSICATATSGGSYCVGCEEMDRCTSNSGCEKHGSICAATSGDSYCVQVVLNLGAFHSETSVGGVPAGWEQYYDCTSDSGCKDGSICAATSGSSYCVAVVRNLETYYG